MEAPSPLTPLTDERRQLGLTRSSLSGEAMARMGMDWIHALLVLAPRDTKGSGGRRHPIGAPSRERRDQFQVMRRIGCERPSRHFRALPTSVNTVLTKAGLLSSELLRRGGIERQTR
jgi:hypothetical protein